MVARRGSLPFPLPRWPGGAALPVCLQMRPASLRPARAAHQRRVDLEAISNLESVRRTISAAWSKRLFTHFDLQRGAVRYLRRPVRHVSRDMRESYFEILFFWASEFSGQDCEDLVLSDHGHCNEATL